VPPITEGRQPVFMVFFIFHVGSIGCYQAFRTIRWWLPLLLKERTDTPNLLIKKGKTGERRFFFVVVPSLTIFYFT